MQSTVSPKVADDQPVEKPVNRAGIPYCSVCRSLLSGDKHLNTHSGWLHRKKSKFHKKTKRFFIVLDGHLLYYSSCDDISQALPKGVLHLAQGAVTDGDLGDSPQTFYVSGIGHEPLKLEASSDSEKRQWLAVLTNQISSKPSSIRAQTHSRICDQCGDCIDLDSFTLGSHVGWLTKQGGDIKTWKKRWVVLADVHMSYYHSPDDVAVFKPIGMLHVVKAALTEQAGKPFMFTVNSGKRVFYFVCENEQEYLQWIEALKIN